MPAKHEHDKPAGERETPAEPAAAQPQTPRPEPPARTAADEQRERSDAIEAEGVEKYKARVDERSPEERQSKPVQGVGKASIEAEKK